MATSADDTVVLRPTALVQATVAALDTYFFEPLAVADLLTEAWEGATAALARAPVSPVPPAPAYPADPAAAYALHAATFPGLEDLASGRVSPEDLAVAAIDELLRRRQDGHTFWLMPQTRARVRRKGRLNGGSPRTFGMIMTAAIADAAIAS